MLKEIISTIIAVILTIALLPFVFCAVLFATALDVLDIQIYMCPNSVEENIRRTYYRDMDISLVYELDEDGDLIQAKYVWDGFCQTAFPALLEDPEQYASYILDTGDYSTDLVSQSDYLRDRIIWALDLKEKEWELRSVKDLHKQLAAAQKEIQDLTSKVEKYEKENDLVLQGLERAGWPCRLVELPDHYLELCHMYEELKTLVAKKK